MRNKLGFTLVEILIVVAIAAILLSIGWRTYYNAKDNFVYNDALNKTLSLIKTARNSAINITPISIKKNDGSYESQIPEEGYGIHINVSPTGTDPHITAFANTGKDKSKFDNEDYIIEKYLLPKQIKLDYLIFDYGTGGWQNQDNGTKETIILFKPPLADTSLIGDKPLQKLGLRFFNRELPASSPKKCQYIRINKIKGYPYVEYDNCKSK